MPLPDYTGLVQRAGAGALQQSLNRIFGLLREEIAARGGTVKEYQGDAILAFWEADADGGHVTRACAAALALDAVARRAARDPDIWSLGEEPLHMDWALATGPVTLDTFGAESPLGLSMVGEPVVLAFRLEKLAAGDTGTVLACPATRAEAGAGFRFRDLGQHLPPGYRKPIRVFTLEGTEA
jgi:adenylate cyclase